MRREFRPAITALESRVLLSAGVGVFGRAASVAVERAAKPAPLAGTFKGLALGITSLQSNYHLWLGITSGKVGKLAVAGLAAFTSDGHSLSPSHGRGGGGGVSTFYLNGQPKMKVHSDSIALNILGPPTSAPTPNGPIAVPFQVVTATGVFRKDVGLHVTLTVTLTGTAGRDAKFSAKLSPS